MKTEREKKPTRKTDNNIVPIISLLQHPWDTLRRYNFDELSPAEMHRLSQAYRKALKPYYFGNVTPAINKLRHEEVKDFLEQRKLFSKEVTARSKQKSRYSPEALALIDEYEKVHEAYAQMQIPIGLW